MAKNDADNMIKINKTQLENLLRLGLSCQQICDFFVISRYTLTRFVKANYNGMTFEQLKAEHGVQAQASIIANLMALSKRNASAAIFLAKSVCGLNENYSAPANEDAENAFAGALKKASRSISQAKDLVSIPDDDGSGEDML